MASLVGYLWFGIGALGVLDALRHSAADWLHADRQRAFWVIFMTILGPLFVALYLAAVRPRFPSGPDPADAFLKD